MSGRRWLLIVYDGRGHDIALHALGLRPSKKPRQYHGFYALNARPLLARHIERLKAMGVAGIARKVAERQSTPSNKWIKQPRQVSERQKAQIVLIEEIRAARLRADEEKMKRELRRQGEILRQRDAAERARNAILRVRGEV